MAQTALEVGEDGGCISALSEKGRLHGFIDYDELVDCMKSKGICSNEQIENIVEMLLDMRIEVSGRPV